MSKFELVFVILCIHDETSSTELEEHLRCYLFKKVQVKHCLTHSGQILLKKRMEISREVVILSFLLHFLNMVPTFPTMQVDH